MKVDRRHSLSAKLLKLVLLWALLAGMVLSLAQILFDLRTERQAIARDAHQILAMFYDPASQAIFSLDKEMATQVIEGLFAHKAVRFAAIGHPDEAPLASRERRLSNTPYRNLTDLVFDVEQRFSIGLHGRAPYDEYYGDLQLTLDTAPYGQIFLRDSLIILLTGLLRALLMAVAVYLVYHVLLTRPLSRIIDYIANINPDQPGKMMIPMLSGHEKNELGLWITKINALLTAIERNRSQRREAEASMRDALSRDEFHLVYQPQISLADRRVVGVEALLRWNHPERGLVPPDLFIPLAEQERLDYRYR